MNKAERLSEAQSALAEMREDLRTKTPNTATDAAEYLLAALKRRGLRLVTEDEWEQHFEDGEAAATSNESKRLEEALLPPFDLRPAG